MKITWNWLHKVSGVRADMDTSLKTLADLGIEIEAVQSTLPAFSKVITGRITATSPHPEADKLQLCTVHCGTQDYSVVCGAANARSGLNVALALMGAELPGLGTLKPRKIRGVESQGMICAKAELGLEEHSDGIWELPADTPVGMDLRNYLGADYQIELSITPNRPDCLGVWGLSRELSLRLDCEPEVTDKTLPDSLRTTGLVRIEDKDCLSYSAAILDQVEVKPSPEWLIELLQNCGLRPINNVVDFTNYLMLLTGHPLHAFDASDCKDGVQVRSAQSKETLLTLDGVNRQLTAEDLLIAAGDKPLALAGVMGGEHSGVSLSTTRVFLEVACFDPVRIRRMSKRHRLHTDASHRFERGMSPEATEKILAHMVDLLVLHTGARLQALQTVTSAAASKKELRISLDEVKRLLGSSPSLIEIGGWLRKLGCQVSEDGHDLLVIPPSFRPDLERSVDLIEEVARIWGFDRIAFVPPLVSMDADKPVRDLSLNNAIQDQLSSMGLLETITYSFAQKGNGGPELMNPLSEEFSCLRSSLRDNLLQVASHNFRQQNPGLSIFELGKVFHSDLSEGFHLGILMAGTELYRWKNNPQPHDFYDVKGIVEELFTRLRIRADLKENQRGPRFTGLDNSLDIFVQGQAIGTIGTISRAVSKKLKVQAALAYAEIDLEPLLALRAQKPIRMEPIPTHPGSERQLALILKQGVKASDIIACVRSLKISGLSSVDVFDVYAGKGVPEGHYSLGLNFSFRLLDRSLRDEEIQAAMDSILSETGRKFSASLRP